MRYLKILIFIFAAGLSAAAIGPPLGHKPIEESLFYIKSQTLDFARSVHLLRRTIDQINSSDRLSVQPVIVALTSCRIQYKKISFFLDYFYPQQEKLFNGPAKTEVEEPYLETEESQSLQQIESILYAPSPQLKKISLQHLILVLDESASDLISLYAGSQVSESQIMESLHLELIRVMTLYITGYDAPDLKTGIRESRAALESMQCMIGFLFTRSGPEVICLDSLLSQSIHYTRTADFDHFDRLAFLTTYAIPLEEQLVRCIQSNNWQFCSVSTLNYAKGNLFKGELMNDKQGPSKEMIEIGRALFFETALSGNNSRSCASCHRPEKYFTDGLITNKKINSDSPLKRNTPTLLYATCQSAQFWDGRVSKLSEQITTVLTSPEEMNASVPEIENRLSKKSFYRHAFNDSVNIKHIQEALTAYLQTLKPMNSAFDRYMAGDSSALSNQQKQGFNLFMGKAQCGTCHFAPLFNGSTPPFFNRSEYEVLGTPQITRLGKFISDTDQGRYNKYPIPFYLGAFKTPTIRNVARTGPYMHNGQFQSLRAVIEFYNKGGGVGIGIASPGQTLSDKPLHLSRNEINNIVLFLQALTDKLTPTPNFHKTL